MARADLMPAQTNRPPPAPSCRSVYVVDDDAAVREATHILLEAAGYAPRSFVSGQDFLDHADLHSGGVALLDICMPGPSGLEVQASLVSRASSLSVIVLTGHGDVATAVQAMKAGAADFLEKPYQPLALVAAVERALGCSAETPARTDDARELIGRLRPRETEVLLGLLGGGSNKSIARELKVSPRTVEMHRANMMERLGARSLAQALRIAHEAGVG